MKNITYYLYIEMQKKITSPNGTTLGKHDPNCTGVCQTFANGYEYKEEYSQS